MMVESLLQQDFFRKLMELFRICEDIENVEGLHMIYRIVKGISKYRYFLTLSICSSLCWLILIFFFPAFNSLTQQSSNF